MSRCHFRHRCKVLLVSVPMVPLLALRSSLHDVAAPSPFEQQPRRRQAQAIRELEPEDVHFTHTTRVTVS